MSPTWANSFVGKINVAISVIFVNKEAEKQYFIKKQREKITSIKWSFHFKLN